MEPFFLGTALTSQRNRERVSADLTAPGLSIAVALAACAALGLAAMVLVHQLVAIETALKLGAV